MDYDAWAETYDTTRAVSASLLAVLLEALGSASQRQVVDMGGGTGNFAVALSAEGFRVTLFDISRAMVRRAARKLSESERLCVAGAEALPFSSSSFDCALSINVLHHLRDRKAAFAETRRVLRSGPFVLRTTTLETQRAHWAHAYFQTLSDHQPPSVGERDLVSELRAAGFVQVRLQRFRYRGDSDGSFQALKHRPEAFLDAASTGNLAVFKRLPRIDREQGLQALRRDFDSGRLNDVIAEFEPAMKEYGDGVVVSAFVDSESDQGDRE